jgi:hypothetical protein
MMMMMIIIIIRQFNRNYSLLSFGRTRNEGSILGKRSNLSFLHSFLTSTWGSPKLLRIEWRALVPSDKAAGT